MNPNDELDILRSVARTLRVEPDDDALARVRANVAQRTRSLVLGVASMRSGLSVVDLIALLFRPVALTLGTLLLIFGVVLLQQQQDAPAIDLLARLRPVSFSGEELYR